ncbi:hypothetical protein P4C99_02710 [Pontiellaceae bacterium B1224]|nr:hypothetical protein [Pontiellaceae bacterium B1224]
MMKRSVLILLSLPIIVSASVPRPASTYFGLVKDAYGQPYLEGARISFQARNIEVVKQDISGLQGHGINFMVDLEMDDGFGERYAPYAMREGEAVEFVVEVDGVRQTILEASTLTVPAPGSDVALFITTGTDVDGDGLPDEWEQQMLAASGGSVTNINQIKPSDDFDQDGASNWHEYLAGTFAFLDYDYFAVEDLEQTEDGRLIFRFLSVPGKSYGLELKDSLPDTDGWEAGTFSTTLDDPAVISKLLGDGYYKAMYIEIPDQQQFMRLIAE